MKLKMLLDNRCENWNSSDEDASKKLTADSYNVEPNREEDRLLRSLDYTNRTENENYQDLYYPDRFTPEVSEAMDLSCKLTHSDSSVDSRRQDDEINERTTKGSGEKLRRIEQIIQSAKCNMEQAWEKEVLETIYDPNCTQNQIHSHKTDHLLQCILDQLVLINEKSGLSATKKNSEVNDKAKVVTLAAAEVDLCANVNRPETNMETIHELQNKVNIADLTTMGADHAPEENTILASCPQNDLEKPTNSGNNMELVQNETNVQQVGLGYIVSRKNQPCNEKPNERGSVHLLKTKPFLRGDRVGVLTRGMKSNILNDKSSNEKHTCFQCGEQHETSKKLHNHKRKHNKKLICLVCKAKICRSDAFKRHTVKSHPGHTW